MNNQWKLVPVEPTEEMNKAGMRWLTGIQHMRAGDKRNALNEAFKAMTDSAPVPPAGDVECAICLSLGDQCVTCEESEFKAWAEKHFASPDYSQTSAGVFIKDWMRHSFAAWQARSKVVTRLTAERDDWKARCARRVEDIQLQAQRHEQTQSELTKARELIALQSKVIEFAMIIDKQAFAKGTQNVGVTAFRAMGDALSDLAHQSAPAAKGGSDE